MLAVLYTAALGQRCSAQARLVESEVQIDRYINGSTVQQPLGVPAQPSIPGVGPYFSSIMSNGLLCYTGSATGVLSIEDCACGFSEQFATAAVVKSSTEFRNDELNLNEVNPEILRAIELEAVRNAINNGTELCSKLTHIPFPSALFTSEDEYLTSDSNRSVKVVGRQCYSPTVGITAQERSENPPKMTPWEYRYTDSGSSACNCGDRIEARRESFAPTSPLAANFFVNLQNLGYLTRKTPSATEHVQDNFGSCVFFRSGYAFENDPPLVMTPVLGGSSSSVNLVLDTNEASVPLFPDAGPEDTLSCGKKGMTERINDCFFGLIDDYEDELLPTLDDIRRLATICANDNPVFEIRRKTECCSKISLDDQPLVSVIRFDLLRAVQCRRVPEALNSGSGRMRYYRKDAASQPVVPDGWPAEGTLNPDFNTDKLRKSLDKSGFADVCLPQAAENLQCRRLQKKTLSANDARLAGRPRNLNLDPTGGAQATRSDTNSYFGNTDSSGSVEQMLRRSRASVNTCILPGLYADGTTTAIDPCSAIAVFGYQVHEFSSKLAGATEEDFAECRSEEVPSIVEAFYRFTTDDDSASASSMLEWWSQNRPSFYHGAASVPLVLGDFLGGEKCLENAPGRKQPPESSPTLIGERAASQFQVRNEADATCTVRPSCCPDINISQTACDALCTTEMDPLEHYSATLGPALWKKIIQGCASDGPNNVGWCRFVGQYSYDPIIRDFDGAPTPLFSNYDSTGQRACTSQGTVDAGDVLLEDDTIVFLKTAPRTAGSLLHPIFQGQGFLGWGGYNITSPEGWYEAPLDASSREIPVIDANGVVVTRIMPPMLRPRGDSAAYRGIESGIVASTVCDRLNHRGAKPNEGPIRMPGLFPRSFDLEMGWGDVGSCAGLKGDSVIQAFGDQPLVDLTGRGGGSSPMFSKVQGLTYNYLTGTNGATANSQLWVPGAEVLAASSGRVCTAPDANRCVGVCDLGRAIGEGIAGALGVIIGVAVNPLSDFGLFAKLLGAESFIAGGTSIMDAAGEQSGSLELEYTGTRLLHARLRDRYGFMVKTTNISTTARKFYETFPSMVLGCHPNASDCLLDTSKNADFEPKLQTGNRNPIKPNRFAKTKSQTTIEENDKWNALPSIHKTMYVGSSLACHASMQGSGDFKRNLPIIKPESFKEMEADDGTKIEVGVVEADTLSTLLEENLYTLTDAEGNANAGIPVLPATCSLCDLLGSPGNRTIARDECTIDGYKVVYSLLEGVGIDPLAKDAFMGTLPEKLCIYDHSATNVSDGDRLIACSAASGEEPTIVDRLLGVALNSGERIAGPCSGSNALVETCNFDTTLTLPSNVSLSCTPMTTNARTSCGNPRWNNDFRVVFPSPVTSDHQIKKLTTDWDSLGQDTSYCANNWGVKDGIPFTDPQWYRSPYGDASYPGSPGFGPVPAWLDSSSPFSSMYVYCASDRLSVEDRGLFCGGTTTAPEGRGAYEGLRLANRQSLSEVCRSIGEESVQCVLYPEDPGPYSPSALQTIIEAYPGKTVDAVIVPLNFTVVSWAAMFLTFTETTYYTQLESAPPNIRVEAGNPNSTLFGSRVKLGYSDSSTIAEGLCTSTPGTEWFAKLFGWIEEHRVDASAYEFLSLDSGKMVRLTDREVFPGVLLPVAVRTGTTRLTVRSAFNDVVAKAASLAPRRVHFSSSNLGAECTRFIAEAPANFEWLSFDVSEACKQQQPSERVPILFAGGSSAVAASVKHVGCFGCSAGVASFRGAATKVQVEAAPEIDTEDATVAFVQMIDAVVDPTCTGTVAECSNASLPGMLGSLARTIGNARIVACNGLDAYCNRLEEQPPAASIAVQLPGKPLWNATADRPTQAPCGTTDCNESCVGLGITWECNGTDYVVSQNSSITAPCVWEVDPDARAPCTPAGFGFAEVDGTRFAPGPVPDEVEQIKEWSILEQAKSPARCSTLGCPYGGCTAPPNVYQEWWMPPDEAGLPTGQPFADNGASPVLLPLPGNLSSVRIAATSNDDVANFFVDALVGENGECLSASVQPGVTAKLQAAECDGSTAQQFRFVFHEDRQLWRLQVDNPYECITSAGDEPVLAPCAACAVGIPVSDIVRAPSTTAVVPELRPAAAAAGETLIRLSAEDESLALRVQLSTGLCAGPTQVGAFAGIVAAEWISCRLLALADPAQISELCSSSPIGVAVEACRIVKEQLAAIDGPRALIAQVCAGKPGNLDIEAANGRGAVAKCRPPADTVTGLDLVGTSATAAIEVTSGGHGFVPGETLRVNGIGGFVARVATVVWQPYESGVNDEPIVQGALVLNTTELFTIEGINRVIAIATSEASFETLSWTGVIVQISIISICILVHVLSLVVKK